MPLTDLACVRAQLSPGAFDGSGAHAAAIRDGLLQRLQSVLLDISSSDLTKIGVTIKREEGEWEWLRDAFVVALEREDRERAAASLRGNDMAKAVSIGVSKSFLIELAKLLDERGSTAPRLYSDEDRDRAIARLKGRDGLHGSTVEYYIGECVDIVAETLGMRRASA